MSNQNVLTHTFSNGLTLAAAELPAVRTASFRLLMPTGAAGDPPGKEGLLNLLTELCFRSAGYHMEYRVSEEMLCFSETVMSDNLENALDLAADIVLRPALNPKELESERSQALQYLAQLEDDPEDNVFVHLDRAYFTNEYGRPQRGTEESLQSLTADDMAEAHKTRFKPAGAILSVAGRFDWERLKDAVEARFGSWEGSPPPLPKPERRADGCYVHIEQDTEQTHICVAYAAEPPGHPNYYASYIATDVLSSWGGRLQSEIREKRGLAYTVDAGNCSIKGCGYVIAYAATTSDRAQETLDTLIGELKRLAEGVTEEELERSRASILPNIVMNGESTSARAAAAASDLFYLGRVRSLEEIRKQYEAVNPASIAAHLKEFPPENFTVAAIGPRRLEMPA